MMLNKEDLNMNKKNKYQRKMAKYKKMFLSKFIKFVLFMSYIYIVVIISFLITKYIENEGFIVQLIISAFLTVSFSYIGVKIINKSNKKRK